MIQWGVHCREPAAIGAKMQVFVMICCDKVSVLWCKERGRCSADIDQCNRRWSLLWWCK